MASSPEPPGPPVKNGISGRLRTRDGAITWVEEDGTQPFGSSRGVLDHCKACRPGGAVVIIHRNFVVCTFQVGVRGIDSEALAAGPRDLQNVQEDHRGSNGRRKLTAASLRGVGAGAPIACSASKPRASKVARPVGRNISLVGVIPMLRIHVYMGPMGDERSGSLHYL